MPKERWVFAFVAKITGFDDLSQRCVAQAQRSLFVVDNVEITSNERTGPPLARLLGAETRKKIQKYHDFKTLANHRFARRYPHWRII